MLHVHWAEAINVCRHTCGRGGMFFTNFPLLLLLRPLRLRPLEAKKRNRKVRKTGAAGRGSQDFPKGFEQIFRKISSPIIYQKNFFIIFFESFVFKFHFLFKWKIQWICRFFPSRADAIEPAFWRVDEKISPFIIYVDIDNFLSQIHAKIEGKTFFRSLVVSCPLEKTLLVISWLYIRFPSGHVLNVNQISSHTLDGYLNRRNENKNKIWILDFSDTMATINAMGKYLIIVARIYGKGIN